jgi:hypothetical protein
MARILREKRQRPRRDRGVVGRLFGAGRVTSGRKGRREWRGLRISRSDGVSSEASTGESAAVPGASQRAAIDSMTTPGPVWGSPCVVERRRDTTPAPCERCRPHDRARCDGHHGATRGEVAASGPPTCSEGSSGAARGNASSGVTGSGTQPMSRTCVHLHRDCAPATASRPSKGNHLRVGVSGERHEGNGRSDAVRLLTRESLRRV